jgi:hypothetical protein
VKPPPREPVRLSIGHQVLGLNKDPISLEDFLGDVLSKVWKLERELKEQMDRNFALRRQLRRIRVLQVNDAELVRLVHQSRRGMSKLSCRSNVGSIS